MGTFTTLPRSTDPNSADAPAILRHIIQEPVNVVLVILARFADGSPVDEIEKILEVCIGRAEAAPTRRRVVYAADPDVLDAAQLTEIRTGNKWNMAAAYGLKDEVAKRLRVGDAKDKSKVEDAFLSAEEQ